MQFYEQSHPTKNVTAEKTRWFSALLDNSSFTKSIVPRIGLLDAVAGATCGMSAELACARAESAPQDARGERPNCKVNNQIDAASCVAVSGFAAKG